MIRKLLFIFTVFNFCTGLAFGQSFVRTSELFQRSDKDSRTGQLNINQDLSLDTLISRYIQANVSKSQDNGYYGMDGYRIQIYNSSNRNAREESNKANAEFINKFPGIISYSLYSEPGYFKIRVGDFRTKTEATKLFLLISKEFPDAYLVPDIINFPDLNTK